MSSEFSALESTIKQRQNVHLSAKEMTGIDRNKKILDNLSYIDNEDEYLALKDTITLLIEEEMTKFDPPDYLASRPLNSLSSFQSKHISQELYENEMERISKCIPLQAIDLKSKSHLTSTKGLNPPSGSLSNDVHAWKRAINKVKIINEQQENYLLNLDLLNTYGANTWKTFLSALEEDKDLSNKRLESTTKNGEHINLARKVMQEEISPTLQSLIRKRDETAYGNLETGLAAYEVGREVKRLKVACKEKGIKIPDHLCSLSNFVDNNNNNEENERDDND